MSSKEKSAVGLLGEVLFSQIIMTTGERGRGGVKRVKSPGQMFALFEFT